MLQEVALLTDGRFSGGSHGFVVGHICPEAQVLFYFYSSTSILVFTSVFILYTVIVILPIIQTVLILCATQTIFLSSFSFFLFVSGCGI